MRKTITREYDAEGRLVKETIVEESGEPLDSRGVPLFVNPDGSQWQAPDAPTITGRWVPPNVPDNTVRFPTSTCAA